jgi:hypothetical protein
MEGAAEHKNLCLLSNAREPRFLSSNPSAGRQHSLKFG